MKSMKKADLLLMDAVIVTVDKDRRILYHGAMAVTDGRITEVGKTGELEIKYADAKEKIDCEGKIISGIYQYPQSFIPDIVKRSGR